MKLSDTIRLIEIDDSLKPLVKNIAIGDDPALDEQLIKKSRQTNILKYTPNDAKKRFGDAAMLQQWRLKGREIHWLLGSDNDLAGIIWYGKSTFPQNIKLPEVPEETFAIRLYGGYAGHGLARPFMNLSLKTYVQLKQARGEEVHGLWLQTDVDNPAALAAYERFGYQEVWRDQKRITMILPAAEVAKFV